ncbi:protein DMP3-like [Phoenix dactylifera]|uniref:Protein DMP3-like n=1 Tax=Phoenix dactylifera TaxID=42345 RepID=A0A8B7D181_PHODC|nr:protein DMP3-like [Phoenix dactylifera]
MSLRTKSKSIKETPPPTEKTTKTPKTQSFEEEESLIEKPLPPPASLSRQALAQAITSTAHLANLLPTGTLLAFHLLTPVFTKNGSCDAATRFMTRSLLLLLAASCFLACFTDSFRSPDGRLYHGFATLRGMWLFDYPLPPSSAPPDLSKYRLRFVDFVHAVLSVLVFASVALRDKNVVDCFYPQPKHETKEVLDILPLGVGVICSLLFVVFPTRRRGIGYPVANEN